jgi:hypothetical protein
VELNSEGFRPYLSVQTAIFLKSFRVVRIAKSVTTILSKFETVVSGSSPRRLISSVEAALAPLLTL